MPRRRTGGLDSWMSWPSSRMRPLVGSIILLIMRSEVVLPHPLGPTRTIVRPAGTSRLRLSTATVPPGYRFVTPSKVIKTWPSGAPRRMSGVFRWTRSLPVLSRHIPGAPAAAEDLDPALIREVASGRSVRIGPELLSRTQQRCAAAREVLRGGAPVYGVNTGMGAPAGIRLDR